MKGDQCLSVLALLSHDLKPNPCRCRHSLLTQSPPIWFEKPADFFPTIKTLIFFPRSRRVGISAEVSAYFRVSVKRRYEVELRCDRDVIEVLICLSSHREKGSVVGKALGNREFG
jgi:hypothetical protein